MPQGLKWLTFFYPTSTQFAVIFSHFQVFVVPCRAGAAPCGPTPNRCIYCPHPKRAFSRIFFSQSILDGRKIRQWSNSWIFAPFFHSMSITLGWIDVPSKNGTLKVVFLFLTKLTRFPQFSVNGKRVAILRHSIIAFVDVVVVVVQINCDKYTSDGALLREYL